MFTSDSRYAKVDVVSTVQPDGTVLAAIRRRFLPAVPDDIALEVLTEQGDRLDTVTTRVAGDPLQFWRICDANDTLNPFDLVAEVGSTIRVPYPGFGP